MPVILVAILLALMFHSGSCMPGDQESGTGVLLACPFFLLVILGWQRLLLALWRGSRPELGMQWLPGLCGVWTSFVFGVGALAYLAFGESTYALQEAFGLALMALGIVGSLCLGVTLLIWRIWLAIRPASAFSWSWLPAIVFLVLPALPMAFGATDDSSWEGFMFVPWLMGGFFGAPVTGLLLVSFLIEAGVRRSRARRAASAVTAPPPPPPPPPQAS